MLVVQGYFGHFSTFWSITGTVLVYEKKGKIDTQYYSPMFFIYLKILFKKKDKYISVITPRMVIMNKYEFCSLCLYKWLDHVSIHHIN